MRVVYRRLFTVRIRHDWYAGGAVAEGDFTVRPTASTSHLLAELGWRTRAIADGLIVFGEVEPGTDPPVLMRPVGPNSLRLVFELRARNARLLNVADLPPYQAGRTVFVFDNLRGGEDDGRLLLGDAVAGAAIGDAVRLASRGLLTHALVPPVAAATLTLTDRFGADVASVEARSADAATPMDEYRLDLSALRIAAGRYVVEDDQGGSVAFYYDTDLDQSRPLGVIEVYSHTATLTADASDRVPASHRFLSGNQVTGRTYFIQFESLETTWRYIVTKKYDTNDIELGDLSIDGPIAFTGAVSGARAVFTSSTAVSLSIAARGLRLMKGVADPVRELPEPGLSTPLGRGATPADFVSDMFVYV